jgi:hypothetical protein
MTFTETVVVAMCTVFATQILNWGGHLVVAYLQRGNERLKFFREKLLDRYSEFVAVATADLERGKSLLAALAFSGRGPEWDARLAEIDSRRHTLRLDLLRLSLQIRLLEQDGALTSKVEGLAKAQPFMPPGEYFERFNELRGGIESFEKQLSELVDAVLAKHSTRALGGRA